MLGLALGGGMSFGPSEEFAEIAAEIGCNRRSGITDFLNDGIFHNCGLVSNSGVQMTGMCRW